MECQEYNGSVVEKVNVQPLVFKKLLDDLAFEKSYELEVTAKTSKGWGESARTVAKTVKKSGEFGTEWKILESSQTD